MASLRASLLLLCVLSAMSITVNSRKTWVMLLSGARHYYNYSLQSMVFHACQTLMKKGIPASNIVHMNYNDVATSYWNPVKNNLVTMPNGTNWFPGCTVDYSKFDVTPELYLKVLSGDKDGVRDLLGREGRVIESGPDDHIFVYMADHGDHQVFCFPRSVLHAQDLIDALVKMHKEKRFAKMMVYMEACHSGSMFDGLLPDDINIMATTSAKPDQLAFPCCYDKFRGTYVGGLWDNAWNYDTDVHDISKETFADQYDAMVKGCAHNSTPSRYGDLSFGKLVLGEFQGPAPSFSSSSSSSLFSSLTSSMSSSELMNESPVASACGRSLEKDSRRLNKGLDLPEDLRHLGFSVSESSLMFQDIDLIHPPFNLLEIATAARRLWEEADFVKRPFLVSALTKLTEIRREAGEFFESLLVGAVGKEMADLLQQQKNPDVENLECYRSALILFRKSCPGLDPSLHTFVSTNFGTLTKLCNVLSRSSVLGYLERKSQLSPVCWG